MIKQLFPRASLLALGLLAASVSCTSSAMELFSDDFSGFTAPPSHFNGGQLDTIHPVAFGGDLPQWEESGSGTVHVVDHANFVLPSAEPSIMFFQDNVITLDAPVAASNINGATYTIGFVASPAVYGADVQATQAGDALLIEVLRGDDSVLASYVHDSGAWAGDMIFVADSFQYKGDGSGDIRLRVGPNGTLDSGRFEGAIDDISITSGAQIFAEGFSSIPTLNVQLGAQYQTGKDLGFGGDIAGWTETGGGAAHVAFGQGTASTTDPQDFAVLLFADNAIMLNDPIVGSNVSGRGYGVSFDISPAVYAAAVQATLDGDEFFVEVLRGDDSILASRTVMPGAWSGAMSFSPVGFTYVGDGSGDVRLRVGADSLESGRFMGAIDNLTLTQIPEPRSATLSVLVLGLAFAIRGTIRTHYTRVASEPNVTRRCTR